jgi:anthranilate/para-aminobenzoate synthase component I
MYSDARSGAAVLVQRIQRDYSKSCFCCYGTADRVLIGIGRESALDLVNADSFNAVWADINEYIEANRNEYVMGYIGFDLSNELNNCVDSSREKSGLFVPETVIECRKDGCRVRKGDFDMEGLDGQQLPLNKVPIDIAELDGDEPRERYSRSVAEIINAIHAGLIERVTLARKIISPYQFDLAGTFLSDQSCHRLARSFYFSNESIAFSGQSPELLAQGNLKSFCTYKLSGTCAKTDDVPIAAAIQEFRNDPRIIAEHRSAIATIEGSLGGLGAMQSNKFGVIELPTLLHGVSTFTTRPRKSVTVAECLRTIFPFGVNPVEEGLALLDRHENFCRGPYYGLVGCIFPDREFSFSQILRSAFVDRDSSYIIVGAAITSCSTAELEVAETRTKLSGIRVFGCK